MVRARFEGLEALVEAYALEEGRLVFLSLVGPREAVRGILAAWAKGESLSLYTPRGLKRAWSGWGRKTFATTRLEGGLHHGIGRHVGYYFAREEDPRAERLWASRAAEVPIPEAVWGAVREEIALEAYRVVALARPNPWSVRRRIQESFREGGGRAKRLSYKGGSRASGL
ncbi:hypothetical protein [Thermus thermophilus]|uniref:Uncharacterized protein n=1 Tax=Thermus thermophilus JL-18 TaxID=798128 RepID=H9ZV20_THETH|nr:hypothetical protein [Thermus thermophilus]AFH40180.1 hypothetical protein TtJL18_2352 [Thermus thermophilus JL-18]